MRLAWLWLDSATPRRSLNSDIRPGQPHCVRERGLFAHDSDGRASTAQPITNQPNIKISPKPTPVKPVQDPGSPAFGAPHKVVEISQQRQTSIARETKSGSPTICRWYTRYVLLPTWRAGNDYSFASCCEIFRVQSVCPSGICQVPTQPVSCEHPLAPAIDSSRVPSPVSAPKDDTGRKRVSSQDSSQMANVTENPTSGRRFDKQRSSERSWILIPGHPGTSECWLPWPSIPPHMSPHQKQAAKVISPQCLYDRKRAPSPVAKQVLLKRSRIAAFFVESLHSSPDNWGLMTLPKTCKSGCSVREWNCHFGGWQLLGSAETEPERSKSLIVKRRNLGGEWPTYPQFKILATTTKNLLQRARFWVPTTWNGKDVRGKCFRPSSRAR